MTEAKGATILWDFAIQKVIGSVSLFNGISTFVGYFNAKALFQEEQ